MDRITAALQWMNRKQAAFAARSVTYRRGTSSVILSQAQVGRTLFPISDESGVTVNQQTRDYLIPVDGFAFTGTAITPQRGDLVADGDQEYQVGAPVDSDVWQWADVSHTRVRVHTWETKQ